MIDRGVGTAAPGIVRVARPGGLLVPALITAVLSAIYAITACRTVGPGDSGELTVVLSTWGVAHAPGFPLLSLVGNLVSHVVRVGEPAFVLNLLNAIFASLACGVLGYAVISLTGRPVGGLCAGLVFGASRVFWTHALALEVFSLNTLTASLLLYLLCRCLASPDVRGAARRLIPAAVLVASTTLTHHATLILLVVPVALAFAVALWSQRRSGDWRTWFTGVLPSSALAAIAGLTPLAYIPIAAGHDPPINSGDARDLPRLVTLLARHDFGSGTLMSPAIVVNQVLLNGEAASPLGQRHLIAFVEGLPRDLGWAALILAALGLVWIARNSLPLLVALAAFVAVFVAFFSRVNTPILPVYDRITEAFYILPHLLIGFLAGCGIAQLAGMARAPGAVRGALGVVAAAAAVLPAFVTNWPRVDQHRNTFVEDFGFNLSIGMPRRAVFLNTGEIFGNSFYYQQWCLGRRPDVTMVDQDLLFLPWYADELRRRGQVVVPREGATSSRAWLDQYVGGPPAEARPVLAVKLLDPTYQGSYRLEPHGIWSVARLRSEPTDFAEWEREYAQVAQSWEPRSISREYDNTSWEASEGAFYTYALGQLEGLRDAVGIVSRTPVSFARVPALDQAEAWSGRRRADLLGFRADFLRQCLADSLLGSDPEIARQAAHKAMEAARASLSLDGGNVQGLHAAASLMPMQPELADASEELRLRQRLVDQRPGDFSELIPYFRLAIRLQKTAGAANASTEARAQEVQARLVRLLGICSKLDPDPTLDRARSYWSQPLEEIAELR